MDPAVSIIAMTFPSLLALILMIEFLCTFNALINLKLFCSNPKNLTIPSENPTTIILPLFLLENGNHYTHVDYELLVENFLL